MVAETPKNPSLVKRRWYQFSLRTLLLLVAIVAVGCGWLGRKIEQKRQERAAVQVIRALGAEVYYDYQVVGRGQPPREPDGPRWLRDLLGDDFLAHVDAVELPQQGAGAVLANLKSLTRLRVLNASGDELTDASLVPLNELTELQELGLWGADNVTDRGIANLRGLHQLRKLHLCRAHLTDAGLENLDGLNQLEELDLTYTKIAGDGLRHLKGLTLLKVLNLSQTDVGDAAVVQIKSLPRLVRLDLGATKITDIASRDLSRLTQLEYLNLTLTRITDASLVKLESLSQLRQLWLVATDVSDAGAHELQRRLPNCEIHHSRREQ